MGLHYTQRPAATKGSPLRTFPVDPVAAREEIGTLFIVDSGPRAQVVLRCLYDSVSSWTSLDDTSREDRLLGYTLIVNTLCAYDSNLRGAVIKALGESGFTCSADVFFAKHADKFQADGEPLREVDHFFLVLTYLAFLTKPFTTEKNADIWAKKRFAVFCTSVGLPQGEVNPLSVRPGIHTQLVRDFFSAIPELKLAVVFFVLLLSSPPENFHDEQLCRQVALVYTFAGMTNVKFAINFLKSPSRLWTLKTLPAEIAKFHRAVSVLKEEHKELFPYSRLLNLAGIDTLDAKHFELLYPLARIIEGLKHDTVKDLAPLRKKCPFPLYLIKRLHEGRMNDTLGMTFTDEEKKLALEIDATETSLKPMINEEYRKEQSDLVERLQYLEFLDAEGVIMTDEDRQILTSLGLPEDFTKPIVTEQNPMEQHGTRNLARFCPMGPLKEPRFTKGEIEMLHLKLRLKSMPVGLLFSDFKLKLF